MITWQPVLRAALKGICYILSSNFPQGRILGFEKHSHLMHSLRTVNPNHSTCALSCRSKGFSVFNRITEGSGLDARSLLGEGQGFIPGYANFQAFKRSYFTANIQGTDNGLLQKLDALIQEDEHTLVYALEQLNIRIDTGFVCKVLRHQKDLDMAFKFFRFATKKDSFEHSPVTYNLMLSKLAFAKPTVACELVREMLSIGYLPEASILDLLLETLGNAGLLDEAFILIQILGSRNSFVNFNSLIKSLESMSSYEEAFAVFYRAKADGCLIDEATYIQILLLHLKLGQTKEAYHLFMDMKVKGCNFNNLTYDALINSLCKKNDLKRAFEVFGEMKKMNYSPASSSYCQLVLSLGCFGRLQEASDFLQEAEAEYGILDVGYYNDLISGLGKASQLDYALKLLDHMETFSLSPSLGAYGIVIDGLCKAGRLETACDIFGEMEYKFSTSDAFTFETLIVALAKADQPGKATSFFKRMKEKGFTPTLIIYCSLVRCLQYAGRLTDAYELFREMRMKGFWPHRDLYNRLMVSLVKGKKLEETLYLFEDMKTMSWVPNTIACNAVLKMLFNAQEVETFQRVYEEMLEKGCQFDNITHNILLNFFTMTRKLDKAHVLLNDLQGKVDNAGRSTLLNEPFKKS